MSKCKACKLTVNGKRYWVNAQGVVAEYHDDPDLPGFGDLRFCDSAESDMVKAEARRRRANRNRRERDDVMRSLGMVKVRGALGGTYWE